MKTATRSLFVGVLLTAWLAFAAAARINWARPNGTTGSNNSYVMEVMFDGNGSAAQVARVTFTVAFTATKLQRNTAAANAIITAGAALSPPFTLLAADIGPD